MREEIIACGILRKELTSLHKEGFLGQVPKFISSRMHMDPEGLDHIIKKAASKEDTSVSLIYGDCCPSMLDVSAQANVKRVQCMNCCQMLLGRERYKKLLKEGVFFLMPDWLENWRDIFERELGLCADVAKELMEDRCLRLVYLDTGMVPVHSQKLRECAEFLGMEVEIIQVDLENLKNELVRAGIADQNA